MVRHVTAASLEAVVKDLELATAFPGSVVVCADLAADDNSDGEESDVAAEEPSAVAAHG